MRTHLIRLDHEGKHLVRIVIGCVEVMPVGEFFQLLAVTTPYGSVLLPKRYSDLQEARSDCDLLNSEEHPVGIRNRFETGQHTIPSSLGVAHDGSGTI